MIAKGCSRAIRGAVAAVITSEAAAPQQQQHSTGGMAAAKRLSTVVALTYNGSKVGQLRGALGLAFAGA